MILNNLNSFIKFWILQGEPPRDLK